MLPSRLDISLWRCLSVVPPLTAFLLKPKGLGTGGSPRRSVYSFEFKLGGIGRRGGARGEGGAEDQW